MLLRRITQHIKAQNWFAVGIDFVIVVIGVFIGIQVANWNDARLSDRKELEYLQRLSEDAVSSRLALGRDIAAAEMQYTDQTLIAEALKQCELSPEVDAEFRRGLRWLGKFNPPRLNSRTIDELTSTGELYLIDSAPIKTLLAEIVSEFQLRSAVTETVYRRIEPHILAIEKYLTYTLPDTRIASGNSGAAIDSIIIDYDFAAMCQDQSVFRAITAISAMTYSRAATFHPLIEKFEQLEVLIAEQLGRPIQNGRSGHPDSKEENG